MTFERRYKKMTLERRYTCPFGCMSGFTEAELARHLFNQHTSWAISIKLAEFVRRLRNCEEETEL